ncbi:MAG: hypothetical protein GX219_07355 [Tissierellia bacterium]|nr:hypothetical protein [Tissierellia bacterium]
MKKIIILIPCLLLFFSNISQAGQISILINGQEVETEVQPFIENGRTMVPIRLISENLAIEVTWNKDSKEVSLKGLDKDVVLKINDKYYQVGQEKRLADVPPQIKNGRTFVPLRLVAELFGKNVDWNPNNRQVLISDHSKKNFEIAKLVRVVDGDTIIVDRGNGQETVRLILVDSPETKHPNKNVEFFGEEAYQFTKDNLEGRTVYLEKDVSDYDRYKRLLRYVWLDLPETNDPTRDELTRLCFNHILLENGYAKLASFPPNIKYIDEFKQAERSAYEKSLGLWSK